MKKIEQYRTTVRVSAITIFCAISTIIYFLVWDIAYNPDFEHPYIGKGKLFIIGVYLSVMLVTSIILGAHRVDELRRGEIIFYELIALVFANAIAYAQICLIEAVIANISGMLFAMLIQILVLIVWTYAAVAIVHYMSPPEKMIIIYGSHLATEIVYKMSQMEDRYVISESANVDEGFDKLSQKIAENCNLYACFLDSF